MTETKAEGSKVLEEKTERFTLIAKVSDDKLKLFIDIIPVSATSISKHEIVALLKQKFPEGILVSDVLDDAVANACSGKKVENRRVAKGTPPALGADGKIVYLVKKYTGTGEVSADQKGHVNFGDIHLFDNVRKGQEVARIYRPKPGTDGVDVFGEKIAASQGQPCKSQVGSGLRLEVNQGAEAAYDTVFAEDDGFITEAEGKLVLSEVLAIKGNLDFHVGNLDFVGSVSVAGDITQAFRIKATKGITINGACQDATLISVDGDVTVRGFMHGGKGASIVCGKNLSLSVAHGVDAEVKGDIIIEKEALDCELRTQACLRTTKGRLIGGRSYVGRGVEAKELGNAAGKETVIHLCSTIETTTQYAELVVHIDNHEKAVKLLESHLGPFAEHPGRIDRLRSPHKGKMEKLLTKLKDVQGSLVKLVEKKVELLKTSAINDVMQVNYLGKMFSQTSVKGREAVFTVKDDLSGPATLTYIPAEDRFEQGQLKPL